MLKVCESCKGRDTLCDDCEGGGLIYVPETWEHEPGELALYLIGEGFAAPGCGRLAPLAQVADASVCAQARCATCGQRGMHYEPYVKGNSYRAIAVCLRCGCEEEF